jgi:hypothetical protein
MATPIFHGQIVKGKLILDTPSRYLVQLSKLENKRIELTLKKEKSQRSLDQNSYYWGVVVEILRDYFGYETYEAEEVHDGLKLLFLRIHEDKGLKTMRSTKKLNTVEFEDYLEKIRRWAIKEHNCFIPSPNEAEGFAESYGRG